MFDKLWHNVYTCEQSWFPDQMTPQDNTPTFEKRMAIQSTNPSSNT